MCFLSGMQHIHCGAAETATFYRRPSTFGIIDVIMHAALRAERLCSPFLVQFDVKATAADVSSAPIIKDYLLIVFDLIVHDVGGRLFDL